MRVRILLVEGCADSLSVCPTPVCIRTHITDHVCTLKILQSMSEFGGLWKHKNNQHAPVPPNTECGCPSDGVIKNGHILKKTNKPIKREREIGGRGEGRTETKKI